MSNHDSLGDRMKSNYENRTQYMLPRRTYTLIRLDGKAFHTYTRDLQRPYDLGLMDDMDATAKYLCENIQGAKIAYVQSDEITLVLTDFDEITTDAWFDGDVQKICSISASMAAAEFNFLRMRRWGPMESIQQIPGLDQYGKSSMRLALFDSRTYTVPDLSEVANQLLWRQQDAVRNSVQMVGQAHFSQRELQGVSCAKIKEKLIEKGTNWDDCPGGFKYGRMVVKNLRWVECNAKPQEYVLDLPQEVERGKVLLPQEIKYHGKAFVGRGAWEIEIPPVFNHDWDYIKRRLPIY
jgi:tRNA(His) guanylyltransferase